MKSTMPFVDRGDIEKVIDDDFDITIWS